MTGLTRLDDLQACVEERRRRRSRGRPDRSRGLARRRLDPDARPPSIRSANTTERSGSPTRSAAFRRRTPAPIPTISGLDLSPHEFLSVPVDEVRSYFARFGLDHDLRFVPGFFHETMPTLRGGSWALLRLDGDTYESTWTSLDALYPGLAAGGYVIIDDYGFVPACRQAVEDYRREHGIDRADRSGRLELRALAPRRSPDVGAQEAPAEAGPQPTGPGHATRRGSASVPTERELELEREIAELRARLGEEARPMIVFASAVTDPDIYERAAAAGIGVVRADRRADRAARRSPASARSFATTT